MRIGTPNTKTLPLVVPLVVGALLLSVTTIVVIGRLRHSADDRRIAQLRLEALETRVNVASAREWRLIAERRLSPSIVGGLEEALDQAAALVAELSPLSPMFAPLEVLFGEYRRALDAEVALMRAGDFESAVQVDEQSVDPGFERLTDAIRRTNAALDQEASTVRRRTDIYSALVLSAATLVGMLLFVGLHRARSHIKELREAEQRLRQSEHRYRDLFEESTELIFVTGLDGCIVDANRAALAWYGGTSADLLGRHAVQTLVQPEGGEAAPHPTMAPDDGVEHEVTLRRKDGTLRHCTWASSPRRDSDERIMGSQVLIHDITERNILQRQLEQSQKMEVVGRLAGGIAHDFNNLLTTILGYSEMVADALPKADSRRADLEEVQKAAKSAASLTEQLLAFSRRQFLHPEIADINTVVTASCKMLQRVIGEDVHLALHLAPTVKPVKIDRGQFERVLMNLAVNARDAMPDGGTLTITTADVVLGEQYSRTDGSVVAGPQVMLSVSDTGAGMTPDVQAHLFEPFFSTKEVGKGTGLGLATVYGVVKQSQGNIFVYSEPGQGSTFEVYFPAAQELAEPGEGIRRSGPVSPEGRERILLVEDDDGLRSLASRILKRYGYAVLTAANADEALRISEQDRRPIALLLTDVVMPGMNGRALALRLQTARQDLKVLYMSGYTDKTLVHLDMLEDTAFLQKPFTPKSLADKVRGMLDAPGRHRDVTGADVALPERDLVSGRHDEVVHYPRDARRVPGETERLIALGDRPDRAR